PKFDENWAGIKAAGMMRGAYQFFEPDMDAASQADLVVQKVGMLGPGDLPPELDMEAQTGLSPADVTAAIHVWMDRVTQGTGRAPVIYTGKYYWNDNVGTADFSGNPLWIAAYGVNCPDTPDAWGGWAFWQYADDGSVPGFQGNVDMDVFNGTASDLMALAGPV